MITHDVEVLVVGLGPVGSTAALYLAQHGITVAAIEAAPLGKQDLRASTFHAPTIEMLDDMGAADILMRDGLKAPVYQYRDRQSDEVFAFDMSELSDRTRFPFRIQCEQHRMAQAVSAKLESESNTKVSYNQRLLFLETDDDGVTAYVETPHAVEKYRAKYIVGADGANSVVRKLLGLDFPGFTYNEKFLCLSTHHPVEKSFNNLCYVNYISDPEEWLVILRVNNMWRVLLPILTDASDEALLSDENKEKIFTRLVGHGADILTNHRTIYRVHQRVCLKFAVGRICMAGDAVHINSPMGGFGMNSGIHDALNLCEKLVAILRERGDTKLIDLYHRQRHKVTTDFVQSQTIENTKMMRDGWGSARVEYREHMNKLLNDPVARRKFLLKQAMFTSLEDAAAIC